MVRTPLIHAAIVTALFAASRVPIDAQPPGSTAPTSIVMAAEAPQTADQEFDATLGSGSTGGMGVGYGNSTQLAQTFTVGVTGLLTSVGLQVVTDAAHVAVQDLVVEIRPTVNGVPVDNDSNVLAKATLSPAAIPAGFSQWATFTTVDLRAAHLFVTRGDVLAIVLTTTEQATGYTWTTKENATYSGGGSFFRNRLYPRFQSSNRTGGLLVDSGFRTFVQPEHPTTTLAPVADAYVRDGSWASTNFGAASTLVSKKGVSPDATRRSYLKFDISGIGGSPVEHAALRLYGHLSNASTLQAETTIYTVGDTTWGERAVTWNTRPNLDLVVGRVTMTDTAPRWFEIDVTKFIEAERQAGHIAVSFALRNVLHSSAFSEFGSRESGATAPQLVVRQ
jgi:hypothetical protein